MIHAKLGAGIRLEQSELTPAFLATLKHAASMKNPPIAFKGRLVQYAGRILRAYPGKGTAAVHDYHDAETPVLAASLTKRAPGYISLGFPDPRRLIS